MAAIIEIEGEIARLVQRSVSAEVPLSMLEKYLIASKPTLSPILPRGCVATFTDESRNLMMLLVERPPRTETIKIQLLHEYDQSSAGFEYPEEAYNTREQFYELGTGFDEPEDMPEGLDLPLPWEYYEFMFEIEPRTNPAEATNSIYMLQNSWLWWAQERITNWEEAKVYPAIMPNLQSGSICWGSQHSTNESISAKINDLVNNFYSYSFNEDWGHLNFPRQLQQMIRYPTRVNELGIPEFPWEDWYGHRIDWAAQYNNQNQAIDGPTRMPNRALMVNIDLQNRLRELAPHDLQRLGDMVATRQAEMASNRG